MNKKETLQQLEVISPLWAKKIKKYQNNIKNIPPSCIVGKYTLNIGNFACCIVGEAHGLFNKKDEIENPDQDKADRRFVKLHHGCTTCINYSYFLSNTYGSKSFWDELKEFVEHYREEHPNLYYSKLKKAVKQKEKLLANK